MGSIHKTCPVFCQGGCHVEFRVLVDHFDLRRQGGGIGKIVLVGGDIANISADTQECQIFHTGALQPLPHGHKTLGIQRRIHGGIRFALKPVDSAADDLVTVTVGLIKTAAVFKHGHCIIGAAGIGGTSRPFCDGLAVFAGDAFVPDQHIFDRRPRRFALGIQLCQQRGMETHGGLGIGYRLRCGCPLVIAPPVCRSGRTGHIGGGIFKVIARVALSHDHDQVELCL